MLSLGLAGIAAALVAAGPPGLASARTTRTAGPALGTAARAGRLASLYWIFYKEDVERINKFDPEIVQEMTSGPGTYALTRSPAGLKLPPGVIKVENFFSEASLEQAIDDKTVFTGVRVVAEDPEDWRATPMDERQLPIRYMKAFSAAADSHGYQPILVPARDLMRVKGAVCTQKPSQTISQAYIACGMPAAAARARMFVIQAAAVETNLPALRQLVQQGSADARRANPNVIVLATLSAAPDGSPVPTSALIAAAKTILPYVKGLELNSEPANDHELVTFLTELNGS